MLGTLLPYAAFLPFLPAHGLDPHAFVAQLFGTPTPENYEMATWHVARVRRVLHEENLPSSAWLEHPLPIRDPPGVQHAAANEFLRR